LNALNKSFRFGHEIHAVDEPGSGYFKPGTIDVVPLSQLDSRNVQPGCPSVETANAMVTYIYHGIDWALAGKIAGLVTGPINKGAMHKAKHYFNGHTEILASRTHTKDYVMMLAGDKLRVSLVTIHMALAQVPKSLTTEAVFKTITVTEKGLKDAFALPCPRLAVAGINPHAGEEGLFGLEEQTVIAPAIRQAQDAGIQVSGPYPPDTLFYRALKGTWDAVIAMYHDQGLIPFKLIHFSDGVNTTLGLPIVRTSVDHGTAYDIAGKGIGNSGSMEAAIEMAALQAKNTFNPSCG
jgi:4-hydroxythreonine-4-phosphate dehydrogenase